MCDGGPTPDDKFNRGPCPAENAFLASYTAYNTLPGDVFSDYVMCACLARPCARWDAEGAPNAITLTSPYR